METIGGIGEFGLIHRIRGVLEEQGAAGEGMVAVAGDDAAAVTPRPGFELLFTCDAMVEGRHFSWDLMPPRQIGRRAMVMNISDIGAMGGLPRWAVVSLGLDPDTAVRDVLDLYLGFLDALNPLDVPIAGGNITRANGGAFIDVTLIGEVEPASLVRRSGARAGDAVLVSGCPGQASAGLELLLSREETDAPQAGPLIEAYKAPDHRAREGRAMAATGLANAMVDTSDGFLGDLAHICEESRVGAEIHEADLPVSDALAWFSRRREVPPHRLFLGASDDYELIVTCASGHAEALRQAAAPVPLTRVGRITDSEGRMDLIRRDGTRSTLSPEGWNHFVQPG